jgi:hypothetical protein
MKLYLKFWPTVSLNVMHSSTPDRLFRKPLGVGKRNKESISYSLFDTMIIHMNIDQKWNMSSKLIFDDVNYIINNR